MFKVFVIAVYLAVFCTISYADCIVVGSDDNIIVCDDGSTTIVVGSRKNILVTD